MMKQTQWWWIDDEVRMSAQTGVSKKSACKSVTDRREGGIHQTPKQTPIPDRAEETDALAKWRAWGLVTLETSTYTARVLFCFVFYVFSQSRVIFFLPQKCSSWNYRSAQIQTDWLYAKHSTHCPVLLGLSLLITLRWAHRNLEPS